MKTLVLALDIWRLSCAQVPEGAAARALSEAAKVFQPCGIRLELRQESDLEGRAAWCALPETEAARKPVLRDLAWPRRRLNEAGLSLFLIPTDPVKARWSFALVDKSRESGCGAPRESRFLHRFGALFMSEFAFKTGDHSLPGILLAHEIAHALTMRPHPTRAARGTVLADHFSDMGPLIPARDCACMRQSPYLK